MSQMPDIGQAKCAKLVELIWWPKCTFFKWCRRWCLLAHFATLSCPLTWMNQQRVCVCVCVCEMGLGTSQSSHLLQSQSQERTLLTRSGFAGLYVDCFFACFLPKS
jgi:hypothetical protein